MADLNFLSDGDVEALRRFIKQEQNTLQNTAGNDHGGRPSAGVDVLMGSPEKYVAMPPCGEGIPARSGTSPGAAICCIFQVDINGDDIDVATQTPTIPSNRILSPILNPDGSQLRRTVYNTNALPIVAEIVHVARSSYGRWLADWVDATTSTTGTTITPTTLPPIPQQCDGDCMWYWNQPRPEDDGFWIEQVNSCNVGTTTTSVQPGSCDSGQVDWQCVQGQWRYVSDTCPGGDCIAGNPPSGSCSGDEEGLLATSSCVQNSPIPGAAETAASGSPGSGQGDCLCPGDGGNPIYTTGGPTTTAAPDCHCLYPAFCGTEHNESTRTGCSEFEQDCELACCSTTTTTGDPTTTCDCNTTTTAGSCGGGCDWQYIPGGWTKTSDDCSSICPCEQAYGPAEYCESMFTPCVPPPQPPQPPPPGSCGGECVFVWIPLLYTTTGNGWAQTHHGCHSTGGVGWCNCAYPSGNGNECGQTEVTGCVRPTTPAPTTTTIGPCAPCYPPTTTDPPTTTLCPPCTYPCEFCEYTSSQECNALILRSNTCSGDCGCPSNLLAEGPTGSVVRKPCRNDPPTTTSTTITTLTPTTCNPCDIGSFSGIAGDCGSCLWEWSADCLPDGNWVITEDGCENSSACPCLAPEAVGEGGQGEPYHVWNHWSGQYGAARNAWPGVEMSSYCITPTTLPPPTTTLSPPTTTCPTTTTGAPMGLCCIYDRATEELSHCESRREADCLGRNIEGGSWRAVWQIGGTLCADCETTWPTTTLTPPTTVCPPTTTTSTTTSSTTTTTPLPCDCESVGKVDCPDSVGSSCTWEWDGSVWVLTSQDSFCPSCDDIDPSCFNASPTPGDVVGTGCCCDPLGACCHWGIVSDIDPTPLQLCSDQVSETYCTLLGTSPTGPSYYYPGQTCQEVDGCPTTTTGAPTTTTEAPTGACVYCDETLIPAATVCLAGETRTSCEAREAGVYYPGQTCSGLTVDVPCGSATTTTSTTTSTTTTTAAPTGGCCCYNGGLCANVTEAECAAGSGTWGIGRCETKFCAPCATTTTTVAPTTTTTVAPTTTTTAGGSTTTTTAGGGGPGGGCSPLICGDGETLVQVCCLYNLNTDVLAQCTSAFSYAGCMVAGGTWKVGCAGNGAGVDSPLCQCCPPTNPLA